MAISTVGQNGLTNPLTSVAANTVGSASGSALTLQSNGGTTAITVDTSQNVGIGTASPSSYKNDTALTVTGASNGAIVVAGASNGSPAVFFRSSASPSTEKGYVQYDNTSNWMRFATDGAERVRIDSSGAFLIGATDTNVGGGDPGFKFVDSASSPYCGQVVDVTPGYNTYHFFNKNATNNGYRFYVNVDGGIRNYSGNNTNLSDERTKENIELADSYLNKICSIPVKTFNYKDEPRNFGKTLGVIAQDVEKIAPEFVNNDGWIESEPREDEPLKSVYTTDMMFGMMKAIQELNAKVLELEAKLASK